MEHTDPIDAAASPVAVPALFPQQRSEPVSAIVLEVDGEMFELRTDGSGGTHYAWLTGPNPGYGFGSTPTIDYSVDQHRDSIRSFLALVDPTTGYIEDE